MPDIGKYCPQASQASITNHDGVGAIGNTEPLEKNRGKIIKFIIKLNASKLFILEAITRLMLTKPMATNSIIPKQLRKIPGVMGIANMKDSNSTITP